MLRKELRRREQRRLRRTRFIAGVTAIAIGAGLAVGGGVTASANSGNTNAEAYWQQLPGEVCVKPSFSSDDSRTKPFILPDLPAEREYSKVIVKAGNTGTSVTQENTVYTRDRSNGTLTPGDSFVHAEKNSISHVIYCHVPVVPSQSNALTCDTATNVVGRPLSNGVHINMDIRQGGRQVPVSAYIDIRQDQDPKSESGLVVRVTAPGGPYTLPLSIAERDSGSFIFRYGSYLTGAFTVQWVQFNTTYFNKERREASFLVCGELTTDNLVTPTASSVDISCGQVGSYTLDLVVGIKWFIGDREVRPGRYEISETSVVTVRAVAIGPEYGLEPGVDPEFTFRFTKPEDCPLPCLPASAVSYTYYNLSTATSLNPANSGLITVSPLEGYSSQLCDDFWVVVAAWDFSSATSIWPQTLRSTDPAGDHPEGYVSGVGTYFFHAPVECGQGDVYASFSGMPYVGSELFGPSDPFTERFLHEMEFSGPDPTYLVTAPGCNVANPIAPTATLIRECGTTGSIDIKDVANPYIGYTVYRGAADANGSVAALDTVRLSEATEGVFTVVASPLNGYIFPPGTVRQWQFDLGERYDCPVSVRLTLTYMEECAPDSSYTFRVRNPHSEPVPFTYTVAGHPELNGSGLAARDGDTFFTLSTPRVNPALSYTVTLDWGDGTTIAKPAPRDRQTKASGNDKVCALDVQPQIDLSCTQPGSYTIPSILGVRWSIDGQTVLPDEYEISTATVVSLRASVLPGYVFYIDGVHSRADRVYTLTFSDPGPCPEPIELEPLVTRASCLEDGKVGFTLPDLTGVAWFVDGDPRVPGFYPVTEQGSVTITFVIDDDHPDGPFVLKPGAEKSFTLTFTAIDVVCDLTTLPQTDAQIGFIAPTCDLGQQLDPTRFVVENPSVARYAPELSDLMGPEYSVVFVITDPRAVFSGSSNPATGRTLSDAGKTLTIEGVLAGPDRSSRCVTTIELKDPVTYVDTCLGASFTIYRVDGIVYTVRVNADQPFVVDWADGEKTRTYVANQGDSVRVTPSAASDRFTISPDPAPFERTFNRYPDGCLPTNPLTEGSATFKPASCLDMTNRITLVNEPGVQWWVNGVQASAGTWPVALGPVVVEATALPGYGFPLEATTRWTFTAVPQNTDDCLPTLSFTGLPSSTWWLGGAALLSLLTGIALIVWRRREA